MNGDAWERFISSLKEKEGEKEETEPDKRASEGPQVAVSSVGKKRTSLPSRYRRVALWLRSWSFWERSQWRSGNLFKTCSSDVASIEKMAFPLPDKPSIAVLPFANMSGDPKQEFLCDGMTEEIITALSRVSRLFVISRTSTSTYKGKPVTVKQVSEELGVRYVLEGSIQRCGTGFGSRPS